MQTIYHFKEHYVEPVIHHQAFQMGCLIVVEVTKIIAAKIFLTYLGKRFFNDSSTLSKEEVYSAIVLAPIAEEIIFRFCILQGIHLIQNILDDFNEDPKESEPYFHIHLDSRFFTFSKPKEQNKEIFTIPISLSFVDELIYRGAEQIIGCWQKYRPLIRIQLISHVFSNTIPQDIDEEKFVIPVSPPVIEEMLSRVYMYMIGADVKQDGLTDEENKERWQQVFRIHLAALIFAAAHLQNNHSSKADAIIQFTWSYFGGIAYGYLSEKYRSLAPGMIAHGFNNLIATTARICSDDFGPFIILVLLANKVGAYILGTASIDRSSISGQGIGCLGCYFSKEEVDNNKDDLESQETSEFNQDDLEIERG